jgi:hypothetical protein
MANGLCKHSKFNGIKNKIMNKDKLKYLPFNLLWGADSFILPYFILTDIANINILASIGIAFYIYFLDVKGQTNSDYLEEKIKKIEDIHNYQAS